MDKHYIKFYHINLTWQYQPSCTLLSNCCNTMQVEMPLSTKNCLLLSTNPSKLSKSFLSYLDKLFYFIFPISSLCWGFYLEKQQWRQLKLVACFAFLFSWWHWKFNSSPLLHVLGGFSLRYWKGNTLIWASVLSSHVFIACWLSSTTEEQHSNDQRLPFFVLCFPTTCTVLHVFFFLKNVSAAPYYKNQVSNSLKKPRSLTI